MSARVAAPAEGAAIAKNSAGGRTGRIQSMLRRLLLVSFLLILPAMAANAADPPSGTQGITGLFVTTRYPAMTIRAGETTTVDCSVRNLKLPPQTLTLSGPPTAAGWK